MSRPVIEFDEEMLRGFGETLKNPAMRLSEIRMDKGMDSPHHFLSIWFEGEDGLKAAYSWPIQMVHEE